MARHDHLVLTEAGGESIVYDGVTHAIHYLSPICHTIWSLCDSAQTVPAIRQAAEARVEGDMQLDVVLMALRQLAEADLLAGPRPASCAGERSTRRGLLRRM
jgi:hypothetical protein